MTTSYESSQFDLEHLIFFTFQHGASCWPNYFRSCNSLIFKPYSSSIFLLRKINYDMICLIFIYLLLCVMKVTGSTHVNKPKQIIQLPQGSLCWTPGDILMGTAEAHNSSSYQGDRLVGTVDISTHTSKNVKFFDCLVLINYATFRVDNSSKSLVPPYVSVNERNGGGCFSG